MTVWRDVIGQDTAVATLQRAVSDPASMTPEAAIPAPPAAHVATAAVA